MIQNDSKCGDDPVAPGRYATEINIHNATEREARVAKHVIPLVLAGAPRGRETRHSGRAADETIVLPPHTATMDDCRRLAELLLGGPPTSPLPLTIGILEVVSSQPLGVTAVYTVADPNSGSVSIDVEQFGGRRMTE